MNLTNIQLGLIIQLDNKKLSFIQMLGRVFRSDFPECYVIVVKDTQDEVYLDTVLEGFDKKYIYKYG
jgi:superfamily II DNA or RNA helicase